MAPKKLIHYINQFYGGIGGEAEADYPPELRAGVVGPGIQLNKNLGAEAEIVATIICGDSYFAEHTEEASAQILSWVKENQPDGLLAGPAFNAGRYGMACGAVCELVQLELGIPAVTGMYRENPGVELYHKHIYIMSIGNSAGAMRSALKGMAGMMDRILAGEKVGWPDEVGYFPMGRRVNVFLEETGAQRAVEMLLAKVKGEPFTTELPMPQFEQVPPAPPVANIQTANIALVTSGGIVPVGNPDKIESANASRWGKYDISQCAGLEQGAFITVHGGFDPVYALEDADRVLPLDALRALEQDGEIGKVNKFYYATVGNATAVASAERFGEEIAQDMLQNNVQGAILTST